MPQAISCHEIDQMLAQGLSQREVSKRTGIPRATLQRLLKAPLMPAVTPERPLASTQSLPMPQTLADVGPLLLEVAQWWVDRKASAAIPAGGRVETRRYTFHADVGLIELVQREADAERVSYSEVINRALRQYFTGGRR